MVGQIGDTNGLNAGWHFDGNSNDFGHFNNNGTDSTISYVQGKFGQSALFNGTSSRIVLSDAAILKPAGNFSISAWIKTTGTAADQFIFISKGQDGTTYNGITFAVVSGATGVIRLEIARNTGTVNNVDYKDLSGSVKVNDGAWHWVVGVYDGAFMYVYVDGLLDNNSAWTNNAGYKATNWPRIGAWTDDGSTYSGFFNGNIDELALYGRALSSGEIKRLYNWSVGRNARIV